MKTLSSVILLASLLTLLLCHDRVLSYAEPSKHLSAKELKGLEEKGNRGDVEAIACLFEYYMYEDRKEAVLWARVGDKYADAKSRYHLGLLLVSSNDAREREDGIIAWKKSAEQNYFLAQDELARLYENGKVIKKDLRMAEKWYGSAAMQGDPSAMRELVRLMTDRAKDISTLSEAYGWTFLMLKRATSKWSQPVVGKTHDAQRAIVRRAKDSGVDEKQVLSRAEAWAKKQDSKVPMSDPMDRQKSRCKYWEK